MTSLEDDIIRGRNTLLEHFGSREAALGVQIIKMSQTEQPCDVTFYERPPILGVKIRPAIGAAAMYGAGAERMAKLLSSIEFTDGSTASMNEIWIIIPMPHGGLTAEALAAVDLSDGDVVAGAQGETVRQIVREVYKCRTPEEEDRYLRRYLAA